MAEPTPMMAWRWTITQSCGSLPIEPDTRLSISTGRPRSCAWANPPLIHWLLFATSGASEELHSMAVMDPASAAPPMTNHSGTRVSVDVPPKTGLKPLRASSTTESVAMLVAASAMTTFNVLTASAAPSASPMLSWASMTAFSTSFRNSSLAMFSADSAPVYHMNPSMPMALVPSAVDAAFANRTAVPPPTNFSTTAPSIDAPGKMLKRS